MSKYLLVYQLLVPKSMFVGIIPHSVMNLLIISYSLYFAQKLVAILLLKSVFLIKHSNLFLITHFSVLFQDESLRLMNSHFVQLFPLCAGTHTLSIFNIYPLRNSRIVRYNSGIGGQSENSHFAQDNSGIVPILTLRRTSVFTQKHSIVHFS